MRHLFLTSLACLTLVVFMSMSASAQEERTPWDSPMQSREVQRPFPTQDPATTPASPIVLNATDPDHTGYPYINNWKGNLVRDPKVFLSDAERTNMTQARVDLTTALAPIVLLHQNRFRNMLTQSQYNVFEGMVAYQDLEKLAAMTDDDVNSYVCAMSQRVRLDAWQEDQLRYIMRHMMTSMAPAETAYAARFDQEIASAEQRVLAERTLRTTISTSTVEIERK